MNNSMHKAKEKYSVILCTAFVYLAFLWQRNNYHTEDRREYIHAVYAL